MTIGNWSLSISSDSVDSLTFKKISDVLNWLWYSKSYLSKSSKNLSFQSRLPTKMTLLENLMSNNHKFDYCLCIIQKDYF